MTDKKLKIYQISKTNRIVEILDYQNDHLFSVEELSINTRTNRKQWKWIINTKTLDNAKKIIQNFY